MSKFTPGPWVVVNGTDVFSALGAPRNDGIKADHNDGWLVADCGVGVTFVEGLSRTLKPSEQRANAHLIAAAPGLFDALVELLRVNDKYYVPVDREMAKAMARARIVIEKARGEE
jgi:hypothetical protein